MEGLYGQDKTTFAVNPYSHATITDDFRPGTPDEWANEVEEFPAGGMTGDGFSVTNFQDTALSSRPPSTGGPMPAGGGSGRNTPITVAFGAQDKAYPSTPPRSRGR